MHGWNLYKKCEVPIPNFPMSPQFSEHQQLELFKVLCCGRWIEIAQKAFYEGIWYAGGVDYKRRLITHSFEEAVCGLILKYWEEMSTQDKAKIKKILEDNI